MTQADHDQRHPGYSCSECPKVIAFQERSQVLTDEMIRRLHRSRYVPLWWPKPLLWSMRKWRY